MKKAKLMLGAIVVVAIVGGAFAFKTKGFVRHILYTGVTGSGVCTVEVVGASITVAGRGILEAASTTRLPSDCPDNFVTTVNDTQ